MIDLIDRSRKLHILIGQSGDTNGSPLFYLADISLIDIGHHPDIVETGNGKHLLPLIRTDLHIPVYILIDDKAGDRRFHHIGRWVCYVINGIHFLDTFGLGLGIGLLLLGLQEGPDGRPLVGYLDREAGVSGTADIVTAPIDEAATAFRIEIGALCDEEPAVLNAIAANNHFPSIILPESVAERAAGLGDYHSNPYTYSFAGASFTAEDHAKASDELEALARDLGDVVVNVSDIENAARQNRLIAQAFQLFVLCFSVITTLIAVANVFNTLANGIILRTREFAALRSIGMGNRAFARMLAYECASYALRGLGIGLAAAVAVTFALFAATSMAFAGLEFTLPWDYVALAVAIVAVVLALSVAYALRRSHASNIVEALRSDAI